MVADSHRSVFISVDEIFKPQSLPLTLSYYTDDV